MGILGKLSTTLSMKTGVVLILCFCVFFMLGADVVRLDVPMFAASPMRASNGSHVKAVYPAERPRCIDRLAATYGRVEDIFCMRLPQYLPHLKNPCFYDYTENNQKRLRCMPYFYVIGMDKSGTTDLHSRIARHPLIFGNKGSVGKETMYWSWYRYGMFNKQRAARNMTLSTYLDKFSETAILIQMSNNSLAITGDATPMDLWDFRGWPKIPQNQGKQEPEVLTPHFISYLYQGAFQPKFIAQFREPVERLYSDYIFLNYGRNVDEFHVHVVKAIEIMESCLKTHSERWCHFSDHIYRILPARIHLGCYPVFLKEWFQVFPRSYFHITRTDEYEKDMEGTLTSLIKFLEIPPLEPSKMADIVANNRRHVTANKRGTILPETVELLRKYYSKCNAEMANLLGDDRYLWLDHYTAP